MECDKPLVEYRGFYNPEIQDVVVVKKRRHRILRKEYVIMFQEALVELAKDHQIRGLPRAVLDYLLGRMDYDNWLCVDQERIANDIGASRPRVSQALKLLVEKGILRKGKKLGRHNTYQMNWEYSWKGSSRDLARAQLSVVK